MKKDFIKGVNIGLGFVFVLSLLGLVYAVGFHIADEVLSGTFSGNFDFNGSVNFTNANVSGLGIILGTEQTASGTNITFNGIPSGTKRITVMFNGINRTGSSNNIILQIGDFEGIETNSYFGTGGRGVHGAFTPAELYSTGFTLISGGGIGDTHSGQAVLTLLENNTWTYSSLLGRWESAEIEISSGSKQLSAELDRLSITTEGGSGTFSGGSINVQYE